MSFEFSDEDRELDLHTFDENGAYIGIIKTHIKANMGVPNRAVFGSIPTENNPVWNNNFRRVEYSDAHGAHWFINGSGEKITLDTNQIKPVAPKALPGHVVVWENGDYQQIQDNRDKTLYSTSTGEEQYLTVLGPIPAGLTETPRPNPYHVFEGTEWVYKREIEEPIKTAEMRKWRDENLDKVVALIDKYHIDQLVDTEYKSSKPIDDDQALELYALRKALQDFPETTDFPFCELLTLPEWLN